MDFLKIFSVWMLTFWLSGNGYAQESTAKVQPRDESADVHENIKKDKNETLLIPQKSDGKFGFINTEGKVIIPHLYSNVGFFAEDCQLQNSPNPKVRVFGSAKYAAVRYLGKDYRISKSGKRVYAYRDNDLGKCPHEFRKQLFHAYVFNDNYGIIEDSRFENPGDYRQFTIYPQYDYLHILEGDDLENPMIIAAKNNRFGIIDINNRVIVPFEYSDIKRNFSWKLAQLFEVTKDGQNYFFIDIQNKAY